MLFHEHEYHLSKPDMKYLPTYEQLYEKMSEEKKEYYRCRWGYNCTTTDTNLEEFYDYYYYGSMRPAAFAEDQHPGPF